MNIGSAYFPFIHSISAETAESGILVKGKVTDDKYRDLVKQNVLMLRNEQIVPVNLVTSSGTVVKGLRRITQLKWHDSQEGKNVFDFEMILVSVQQPEAR